MLLSKKDIIKSSIYFYSEPFDSFKIRKFELSGYSSRIILFGSPIHGNIGDHLIAQSEIDYLYEFFLIISFSILLWNLQERI